MRTEKEIREKLAEIESHITNMNKRSQTDATFNATKRFGGIRKAVIMMKCPDCGSTNIGLSYYLDGKPVFYCYGCKEYKKGLKFET